MSVELEDHPEVLAELGPELEEVLRSSWAEATRVMSPGPSTPTSGVPST